MNAGLDKTLLIAKNVVKHKANIVKHYGQLMTKDGARQLEVAHVREARDHLVATFKGVATREDVRQAVQDLKGDLAERLTDLREAITSRPRRRQEGA